MRLFIAIIFTEELKTAITKTMLRLTLAGVKGRYVSTETLHMTMAFLGEVEDPEAVKSAMKDISWRPFTLRLTQIGNFGDLVWLGLDGGKDLSALAGKIRSALDAAGIRYDRKKFVPHITLIRKATGHWKGVSCPGGAMRVEKIALMKSEVKDGKRVYTQI